MSNTGKTYFTRDGQWGDTSELVEVDTSNWGTTEWLAIEASEKIQRRGLAILIEQVLSKRPAQGENNGNQEA